MEGSYNLDSMMGQLGDFGKYQAWQFTLHILSAVTAGLNMLSLVTVAAVPEFRCEIPGENGTMTYTNDSILLQHIPLLENGNTDSCSLINATANATYNCDRFVYNSTYYQSSRAVEWNFVCDQRWMGAVAQSAYMFGVFTGAVTLGNMADKYGRKPVFCWSAVLQLILGVGVAFTNEYYSFLVIRYLYGIFGSAGSYIPGFVLTMELVGPSKRSSCGISFQAAFSIGMMLVAAWGALIPYNRQLLQIIYGCHALMLIPHIWVMDESPRWLWANGRQEQAIGIIKKALRINKNSVRLDAAAFVNQVKSDEKLKKHEDASMFDLFKTPRLRIITLNVCLCWFANSLVYYGLSLSTGSMKGNPFFNLFILSIIELPSYVITVYVMDKLGRRAITSFNMIVGSLCCIIAAVIATGSFVSIGFIVIGKFLISSSFAVIYNYSAEIFPTVVRNSAMGLGSMCARTSGALTPLITLLDSFNPKLPSILFAMVSLVSGVLVMFLPETLNKPMPQSIEDGENFGVGDSCFTTCLGKRKVRDVQMDQKPTNELEPLN